MSIEQLVVAVHLGKEVLLCLAGETEHVGQLLEGVGLLHDAGLQSRSAQLVDARSLANAVSGESRASGLSEAVDVGGSVAVEDLAENTARLQSARIADVVIGQRLVGEAHAVAVHGHERLASHIQLNDGAGEDSVLARADVSGVYSHVYRAAVEDHGTGYLVHGRASPQGRLDARTVAHHGIAVSRHAPGNVGLQGLDHSRIGRVASGGQQYIGGIDLHVAVFGLEDGSGHLGSFPIMDELHELMLEIDGMAGSFDVLLIHIVAQIAGIIRSMHVVHCGSEVAMVG